MSKEPEKNIEELFVVQVINKKGEKAFYCEMPTGTGFYEKICLETRLFKTWGSAKMKANELNKHGTPVVIKMSQIINDQKLATEYGLTKSPSFNIDEMCFIVGYDDDGTKNWIHFDVAGKKYFPEKQKAGACLWHKDQVEKYIKAFSEDPYFKIKTFTYEDAKSNENN